MAVLLNWHLKFSVKLLLHLFSQFNVHCLDLHLTLNRLPISLIRIVSSLIIIPDIIQFLSAIVLQRDSIIYLLIHMRILRQFVVAAHQLFLVCYLFLSEVARLNELNEINLLAMDTLF